MEDLPDYIQDNMGSLLSYYSGVEDFCEHADDIILWSGCDTTADVAEQMLDEGLISDEKMCIRDRHSSSWHPDYPAQRAARLRTAGNARLLVLAGI